MLPVAPIVNVPVALWLNVNVSFLSIEAPITVIIPLLVLPLTDKAEKDEFSLPVIVAVRLFPDNNGFVELFLHETNNIIEKIIITLI